VSQPACLHDLLWCFVAALEANSDEAGGDQQPQTKEQVGKNSGVDVAITIFFCDFRHV
jgi:hypothetical protein